MSEDRFTKKEYKTRTIRKNKTGWPRRRWKDDIENEKNYLNWKNEAYETGRSGERFAIQEE